MDLNIFKEETQKDILDQTNKIAAYTKIIANKWAMDSWNAFKALVDAGAAKTLYPVGTQMEDKWNNIVFPWDIVHHYPNGDVGLNWHYATPYEIPFDAPEAMAYAPSASPAGTYHILIGENIGTGWVKNVGIQFTFASPLDEGDQLVLSGVGNNNDPTENRTITVYAKGSTTAKQTATTSAGTEGTLLGTIYNTHTSGVINSVIRMQYGSNVWSQSAYRQYLNSMSPAGSWWTAQNGWDRPPAQATQYAGFLAGFSEEFLGILEPVDVVTALNTVEGYPTTTETTQDKIFFPSLQEKYISPQLANVEGADWDYYKALAEEAGLSGKFAQYGTYEILKKYSINNKTSSLNCRLRSAGRGHAGHVWLIVSSGIVSGNNGANLAYRCDPACIIKKSS